MPYSAPMSTTTSVAGSSNGLAWSPDSRTMYYADSFTPYVWAWDFDPASAEIANRRTFLDQSVAVVDDHGGPPGRFGLAGS